MAFKSGGQNTREAGSGAEALFMAGQFIGSVFRGRGVGKVAGPVGPTRGAGSVKIRWAGSYFVVANVCLQIKELVPVQVDPLTTLQHLSCRDLEWLGVQMGGPASD